MSALALDGGGSATYAGRPEGSSKLEVRNSPADGAERAVSSSILMFQPQNRLACSIMLSSLLTRRFLLRDMKFSSRLPV